MRVETIQQRLIMPLVRFPNFGDVPLPTFRLHHRRGRRTWAATIALEKLAKLGARIPGEVDAAPRSHSGADIGSEELLDGTLRQRPCARSPPKRRAKKERASSSCAG